MNQRQKQCSHAGFWLGIALLGFLLVISVTMNMGLLVGAILREAGSAAQAGRAEDQYPFFTETWSYGTGDVKVVRIPVDGVIFREEPDRLFGPRFDKVESILRQIRAAGNDEAMTGILLEVNSPGGDLTSSDEIYQALQDFKASHDGRQVIVFTRNMAASGGYYVSMSADWIIAEPTALIGSIGVIMQTLNWKGLSDRIGVTDTTIKSGANKDMLNPFHDVPPEQLALLQGIVDRFYDRFFRVVKESRNLADDALIPIADGRIVTADDALTHRLIDQIGYWDDVVRKTAELLGAHSVKVVRYEYKPNFFELLTSVRTPLSLPRITGGLDRPRFLYLWKP